MDNNNFFKLKRSQNLFGDFSNDHTSEDDQLEDDYLMPGTSQRRKKQSWEYIRNKISLSKPNLKRELFLELAEDPDVSAEYEVVKKMVLPKSDEHIKKVPDVRPKIPKFLDYKSKAENIRVKNDGRIGFLNEEKELELAMAISAADAQEKMKMNNQKHKLIGDFYPKRSSNSDIEMELAMAISFADEKEKRKKQKKIEKSEAAAVGGDESKEFSNSILLAKNQKLEVRKEKDQTQGAVFKQEKIVVAEEQKNANCQLNESSDDKNNKSPEMFQIFRQFVNFMREVKNYQPTKQETESIEEIDNSFKNIVLSSEETGAVGGDIEEQPGVECPICLINFDENMLITNTECGHVFCSDCTIGHLTALINDGKIDQFPCPGGECKQNIALQIVERILPEKMLEKYENMNLRRTLSTLDNVHDCPRCDRQIECDIDIGMGECPHLDCQFFFCTSCMRAYHGTYDCGLSEEEQRQMIEAHKQKKEEKARRIIEEARRRREAENLESSTFIKSSYKKCPGCHKDIEKSEGCNHMTCKCGVHFCYLCGQQVDAIRPHDHFNRGACILFYVPPEDK